MLNIAMVVMICMAIYDKSICFTASKMQLFSAKNDGPPELHHPQRRGRREEHAEAHRHAGGFRRRAERLA